mgnify:CR=1 FL=1
MPDTSGNPAGGDPCAGRSADGIVCLHRHPRPGQHTKKDPGGFAPRAAKEFSEVGPALLCWLQ